MKKFAGQSLHFVIFSAVFFIIINIIYLSVIALTDWDFGKRLDDLNLEKPDYELLVIGNSFPEYGIDTELLTENGIKSYNLSIIGNSDETCFVQLSEYLAKEGQKPKYVLFGVSSYTDPFYNQGIEPIVAFTMKGHKFTINDIPIFKFKWLGVDVLKKIVSRTYRNTKVVLGQIKSPKITPDHTSFKANYFDESKVESAPWIGRIAELCAKQGIKLIIIEMPGIMETQNMSEFGPYQLCYKNGVIADLYNFNSRDFCKILDPLADWGGMSHLNQFGAVKITEKLLQLLNKNYN